MKTCSKCLQSKEPSAFQKQSRAKDGLKSWCKECAKKANQDRYQKLKPQILENVLNWQQKNPDRVAAAKEKYRAKTTDTINCETTL
jgi:hypothetical protein